jgi:hypothetical protein
MPQLHRTTSHLRMSLHGGSTGGNDYTLRRPSGRLGMEVATRVTMRVVTTPLMVILSLATEAKPPPLLGTLTGTLLWSDTPVMGLTRLSVRWRGSNDLSNLWMTLQSCKRKCKHPSTHRPA